MLGEINASPLVQIFYWIFLIYILKLETEMVGLNTRLNGGSPTVLVLNASDTSEENDDLSQGNPVPNRLSPRELPGVYIILCIRNNKRYYGQSINVSQRISQHKSRLRRNLHECRELQFDFNLYGEEKFEFSCLYIDRNITKEQRIALEIELIGRNFTLCYNKDIEVNHKEENNPFFGKTHSPETRKQIGRSQAENEGRAIEQGFAIQLDGVTYPSLSQAARETKHSRDSIRKWLRDSNQERCKAVDPNQTSWQPKTNPSTPLGGVEGLGDESAFIIKNTGLKKKVSIYGTIYESMNDAARQRDCSRVYIQQLIKRHPVECFVIES
jgi:hypothetical protein